MSLIGPKLALTFAAFVFAANAAGSAPPPPPPPLTGVPDEIGGYSTGMMNSVFQGWVGSQTAEAGRIVLERTELEPYSRTDGTMFLLNDGFTLSAERLEGQLADYWEFDHVCGSPDDESLQPSGVYYAQPERFCSWQVRWVKARFADRDGFDFTPDFERFAKALRKAGVERLSSSTVPDSVFRSIIDPMPILIEHAVEVRRATERECPAVAKVLEVLDSKTVRLDLALVGEDGEKRNPRPHAATFSLRTEIGDWPGQRGEVQLSDHGDGLASEAFGVVSEALRPCFAPTEA